MQTPKPLSSPPKFFYGTAWKEDLTEGCVYDALSVGFRAIDTANQRKHYNEEGVGAALLRAYRQLGLKREDLFLQTKFTYARGQDHRKPYDENDPFKVQVQHSFESSLKHLHTDYLDSYVLHGPSSDSGITDTDWEVWAKMEELKKSGGIRNLGVSNISYEQLAELHSGASVKPLFVQNRCFADKKWDKKIRDFCREHGIFYEGFSLLTANAKYIGGDFKRPANRNVPQLQFAEGDPAQLGVDSKVREILEQTQKNMQQIIFRFCRQVGIIPIIGTRSPEHMKHDLDIETFILSEAQVQVLENIASL
ncbi:MAG: aldo/keto reductase family protein [Bdellovibrionota bacterium]